jgi:hypothetical protein
MMKQNYFISFSALIVLFSLLGSCNLYNPAEPVPSFIHIERITLSTDHILGEGSDSHKITDAWVYVDGQLIGAFELPVTFPVLFEGTHEVIVKAGIKVNGISATRAPYPFYEAFRQSVTLTKGTITTMSPNVQYTSGIDWTGDNIWMENFDGTGMTLIRSAAGSDTTLIQKIIASGSTDPDVFEGTGAGIAYVDANNTKFEYMSSRSFVLPKGDAPVFLELNYKCNYTFVVGVFSHGPSGTYQTRILNVNASDTWNKIYIYLSPVIRASGNATDYTMFFGMLNNTQQNGLYLGLDNIKLIHY